MPSTLVYSTGLPVVRPEGMSHRETLPEDGPDTYRPMPMPHIRKARASEPWARQTRLTRSRLTVRHDPAITLAHAIESLDVIDLAGLS